MRSEHRSQDFPLHYVNGEQSGRAWGKHEPERCGGDSSVLSVFFYALFLVVALAVGVTGNAAAAAEPVHDATVREAREAGTQSMCRLYISPTDCEHYYIGGLRACHGEILINGILNPPMPFETPCDVPVTLSGAYTEECAFFYWVVRGNILTYFSLSFENPTTVILSASGIVSDTFIGTCFVDLTPPPPPISIVAQPQGAALYEGIAYRLAVSAEGGAGPLYYAWFRNGVPIGNKPFLNVASASAPDVGEYWCNIRDYFSYQVNSEHVFIDVYSRAPEGHHAADTDWNWQISLAELLRVVQFYNVGAFHCWDGTEDGYAAGPGETSCGTHSADYDAADWRITMSELLRMVQFFNALGGAYHAEPGSEDGFAPGAG